MNIGRLIEDNIKRYGAYDFLCYDDEWLSNEELNQRANKLAHALRHRGVRRGDRVGVQLPNGPALIQAFYAVFKMGGIVVPLNPALKPEELSYLYRDAGISVLFSTSEYTENIAHARDGVVTLRHVIMADIPRLPGSLSLDRLTAEESSTFVPEDTDNDEPAMIIYTAGAAGKPLGIMLTHYNWYSQLAGYYETVLLDAWGVKAQVRLDHQETELFGVDRNRVSLLTLPLFHGYGNFVLNLEFLTGGKVVLLTRWNPEDAMAAIERYHVTDFRGVPTMFIQILNHPAAPKYDLSSLKMCICGAAPMPLDMAQEWKKRYGIHIWEGYGLSEATIVNCGNVAEKRPPKYGSVGKCYQKANKITILNTENEELKPGERGEICIKGPAVMKGYWNKPEETARVIRDGWLHSGDIGYVDEEGYLFITGREKDLIIRGGENIYPREIEAILLEHPEVAEVGVVGMPDPVYGEAVKAFVVPRTPGAITEEDLYDFCRERFPSYKRPKAISILAHLPKDDRGQVSRQALKTLL